MFRFKPISLSGSALLLLPLLLPAAGCKARPASVDDATLTSRIQGSINNDAPLAGQVITTTVSGGVATLNGSVLNDAQRTIAARDAAGTPGVKEVINNLSTLPAQPPSQTAVAVPLSPIPLPVTPLREKVKPTPAIQAAPAARHESAPIERAYTNTPQQPAYTQQPTYTPQPQAIPQAPPPPPRPAFREVNLPAGTALPVRISQTLDSATTQQGDTFSGVIASDVFADGVVVLPSGTAVSGQVDNVHEAGHFKGSSLLTVSLSSLSRRGDHISLSTEPYTVTGKGRGANTAEKTGGGAAVGAILGSIFGGGRGAAIGAGAGAGVGAGANAITRGQQVQIQSESVVRFTTTADLSLRVRTDISPSPASGGLQPR